MSKLLDKLFRAADRLHNKYEYKKYVRRSDQRIKDSLKKVKNRRRLTKEQASEVKAFYKELTGRNISLLYHEYFYSRTGVYCKEYMPIGFFEAELIGRANHWNRYYPSYADKNMDEAFLPHIRHPYSILKNINGYFYYKGNPVSKKDAVSLCKNIDEAIIKPSLKSKGKGVMMIKVSDGVSNIEEKTIEEIFDIYKENYLIQEVVHQHPAISALNPTSVNTIRILTYRSDMEIIVVYAVIRIGRTGQVIDNQSVGGISTIIHEDGTLGKYAFGAAGDDMIEKSDTGIVLDGYKIPYFEKVIEAVKKSHYCLPFFDLVGWDVSINEDGDPVLIEWNGNAGPSQTACGTGLGKYTEKIVKELLQRKNTRNFIKLEKTLH